MAKGCDYTQVSGFSVSAVCGRQTTGFPPSLTSSQPIGKLRGSFEGVSRLANTKSAEKAARQSTVHRARNDALTSQLRSAIRKATLALKAGKHAEAAAALAEATPVIDGMVNKGIIHRNKAARHKSRLTKQVRALAK
jgi:small subunit ribosomal protein S20